MRYYLEITLLPNEEIPIYFLWSKVFQQIHLGLVELQDAQKQVSIGVSFPDYVANDQYTILCNKLRLFGQDEATLAAFNAPKWLKRLTDYVHCTRIRPVPDNIQGYAIYQRIQPVTNKERLARRYAKRKNLSYEQALVHYQDMPHKVITLPFIRLKSMSNGLEFCMWIKKIESATWHDGHFSTYGLSRTTTVPEF